ncbi:MAG: phosphotransferase family protein [Acidimicrobiia bacterium]|nr:MAG: phosphotransferase family protein [Acidimicrobiia bacterium]
MGGLARCSTRSVARRRSVGFHQVSLPWTPRLLAVTDTAPIRPDERFDELVVAAYLHNTLPEMFPCQDVVFDQFPGGAANLTYRARCPEGDEWVLRRAPLGRVAEGGHDMAREYWVLSQLWQEYPLAPRAYHYCDDPDVMGKPFFVMERRHGSVIRREWPAGCVDDPLHKRAVAESLVDALCDLHTVDPDAVGLGGLGHPDGFVGRQIDGWSRRWAAAATRPVEDMDTAAELLRADVPEPERVAILHNDFKLDNTMVGEDGNLVAVFDWDMATLGDPLVDIGTLLAYWAQPGDPTYLVFGSEAVAIGDVMPKAEVRDRYARRTGFDVSNIAYYEGLALFRIAVIIEQIYARYVAGQTADKRFADFEPLAPLLAAAARNLLS